MSSESFDVDVRVQRTEFDGLLIALLAYGALLMLYIQLVRVLLSRPKRGKVFWGITIYSGILMILDTVGIGGKIKFAEYVYVDSRFTANFNPNKMSNWVPSQIFQNDSGSAMNVMSELCTVLTPWLGDVFMIYRVMVVWNYQWWLLILPVPLYLSHIGMSIPFLIAYTKTSQARWETKSQLYSIVFHSLCVALNVIISLLIAVRLLTMRKRLEIALGKLHASFYTSWFTVIVESGVFATLWGIISLTTLSVNHWSQYAFLDPYYFVIAITRMLIVLKMAENQAWSRDIVSAAKLGVMDWEVSSSHSDDNPVPDLKKVEYPSGSCTDSTNTRYAE